METTEIGWIGLGNMGIPMAKRLLDAGFPVTVYNRSQEKTVELAAHGAKNAATIAALVTQSVFIFLMVSDDHAIAQLFKSEDGIFATGASGKIFVNMSTVSPEISREISSLCEENGNEYIDAPVSGSVKQAEDGQLVIMVGGDSATYSKVEPLFSVLGKMSLLVGQTGAGNMAKLAINTLLAIQAQGLAEILLFAEKNQVKPSDLTHLINNSAIGNVFMKIKGDALINQNYKAVFAIKHIAKDLRLAKAQGIASPLAETVYHSFQEAEPSLGNEDIIAIVKQL